MRRRHRTARFFSGILLLAGVACRSGGSSSHPMAPPPAAPSPPTTAVAPRTAFSALATGCFLLARDAVVAAVGLPVGPAQVSPADIGANLPLLFCRFPATAAGVTGAVTVYLSSAATTAFTPENLRAQGSTALLLDPSQLALQPLSGLGEAAYGGCEESRGQQPLLCVVLAYARGRAVMVAVNTGGATATAGRLASAQQLVQQVLANAALFSSTDLRLWGLGQLSTQAQIRLTAGGKTVTYRGGTCDLDDTAHTLQVAAAPSQENSFALSVVASSTDAAAPLVGGKTYTSGTLLVVAPGARIGADTRVDPQALVVTLQPNPRDGGSFSGEEPPAKTRFSGSFTCP